MSERKRRKRTTADEARQLANARNESLILQLARDLSVRTGAEIREKWITSDAAGAYDHLLGKGAFDAAVHPDHNPIWYLALSVWFDNNPDLLWPPVHRDRLCAALLEHYLDPTRNKAGFLLLMPRDSFKTTFTQGVFAMFIALRGKSVHGRDERIALFHHKEQQASASLKRLRAKFVQHGWMKRVWPEFCAAEEFGTATQFDWPCKSTGVINDPSVSASGLGASLVGFHQDWQLYSDPVTEEHIDSKVIRDEAFDKYQASRFMLDTLRGKELIDGTRYHVHDMHGRLLRAGVGTGDTKVETYNRLVVKAIADECPCGHAETVHADRSGICSGEDGESCDCTECRVLSFPNRLTYEFLERKRQEEISRSGNDTLWHLQYQNEPRTTTMIAADPSWLKTCKTVEIGDEAWSVILVDGAWKGTHNQGSGDFASIQVWTFERRGSLVLRYLRDGTHSNELTSLDGEREIFRLMRKYGVIDVAVEEHGGHSFRTSLEAAAASRGVFINLIDLKMKHTQKTQRIVTFLRSVQAGCVFICDECDADLREAFLDQYGDFPQLDHDDAIDCAAYTSDPNIAAAFVPQFNTFSGGRRFRRVEEEEVRRTRYCAL